MFSLLKSALLLGAGVILSAVLSFPQTSTTALSGTIYDSSGAVVAGATVTALNNATGVPLKQATNSAGLYSFPSVAVGSYTLIVEMTGFKTLRRTGITLVVGTPATENVNLELCDTREVVIVEAAAVPTNTSTATPRNVTEHQPAPSVPLNGRNPLNLLVLDPAVTQRQATTTTATGT